MSGVKASLERYGPFRLDIDGEVIEVDTNDFSAVSYEHILEQVQAIMESTPPENRRGDLDKGF
jgi:hypothetical protein